MSPLLAQTDSTRTRLREAMERIFAPDPGLGVLTAAKCPAVLSEQDAQLQWAWANALIALHGTNRAAAVYARYARTRQHAEAATLPPLSSWDDLVLSSSPIAPWTRDLYGFQCVSCGERFPDVLILRSDPLCRRCARDCCEGPHAAVPLWQSYSHHAFATPGARPDEIPKGQWTLTVPLSQNRGTGEYTTGDMALFWPQSSRLPGLTHTIWRGDDGDVDAPEVVIDTAVEHDGRRFELTATFLYDPEADVGESHPYGFLLTHTRLRALHQPSQPATEYTDVYDMLRALLTGLYCDAGADPAAPAAS